MSGRSGWHLIRATDTHAGSPVQVPARTGCCNGSVRCYRANEESHARSINILPKRQKIIMSEA